MRIVSFYRSGTHMLAKLLFQNFVTDVEQYEDLHYSHSRLPKESKTVHIYRPIREVAVSMYRMRDRFGVDREVSFADFIRKPFFQLPTCSSCVCYFDGIIVTTVGRPRPFEGSVCDRWLDIVQYFHKYATVSFSFDEVRSAPSRVCDEIATKVPNPRRLVFDRVHERVGWMPSMDEGVSVSSADESLLTMYQKRFNHAT